MTIRVLYASERPPYPFFLGGAARCAHQLLFSLHETFGVECRAIGSSDYAVTSWTFPPPSEQGALGVHDVYLSGRTAAIDCGYMVELFPAFDSKLAHVIDEFKPDIVWSQLEGAKAVLELAERKRVQGLLYVHDAEFDPAELRATAASACHIVCSSRFLANRARRAIGRRAHVVYPPAHVSFGIRGNPSGYLTMINPHRVKGLETFLEIAKRMPFEKFLLVESWKLSDEDVRTLKARIQPLPNVCFMGRVPDMREIYSQTKLLLAPSIWEEGFGMVAIEAQSCAIPVVASARGGFRNRLATAVFSSGNIAMPTHGSRRSVTCCGTPPAIECSLIAPLGMQRPRSSPRSIRRGASTTCVAASLPRAMRCFPDCGRSPPGCTIFLLSAGCSDGWLVETAGSRTRCPSIVSP